jgi:hypothetical protein
LHHLPHAKIVGVEPLSPRSLAAVRSDSGRLSALQGEPGTPGIAELRLQKFCELGRSLPLKVCRWGEDAFVKRAKKKKVRADAVSPFRDKLWEMFAELARGMDGADVVTALKQAGEEIWAVGIDDAYSNLSQGNQDDESFGNAFDITWLTVVCIKLKEMKQGKRPAVRIKAAR